MDRPAQMLDSEGRVVNRQMDSGQKDLAILTAARNSRRILSGYLVSFETEEGGYPKAYLFFNNSVKVIIPFQEMGLSISENDPGEGRAPRLMMDAMLGAKIDYIVRGVDVQNRIAAASRAGAMQLKQRTILNAKMPNGEYRIQEGMKVLARIVSVYRTTARVEVYGFESTVNIQHISHSWVTDVAKVLQVGEERPVVIMELQRDQESGQVTNMWVSLREGESGDAIQFKEGITYTGDIVSFSPTAYFVAVPGIRQSVRCPISLNRAMSELGIGDKVKFYVRYNDRDIPTGAILKVLQKGDLFQF